MPLDTVASNIGQFCRPSTLGQAAEVGRIEQTNVDLIKEGTLCAKPIRAELYYEMR